MLVLLIAGAFMLPACSNTDGAVAKVQEDLYLLQTTKSAGNQLTGVRNLVSKDSGRNIDAFLDNIRDFDYEITGSVRKVDGDDHYTVVTVRIRTCDYGSEYLKAWKDYLDSCDSAGTDPADNMNGFYDGLFRRLAAVKERNYVTDVGIIAIDPLDNGEWITNISSNEELQDALFGGMISEMKYLAGE